MFRKKIDKYPNPQRRKKQNNGTEQMFKLIHEKFMEIEKKKLDLCLKRSHWMLGETDLESSNLGIS